MKQGSSCFALLHSSGGMPTCAVTIYYITTQNGSMLLLAPQEATPQDAALRLSLQDGKLVAHALAPWLLTRGIQELPGAKAGRSCL